MMKLPDEIKEAQEKIKPKEYMELLKCLDLRNIYLKDLKCSLSSNEITDRGVYRLDEGFEIVTHGDNEAIIEVAYKLGAKSGRKRLASVSAKYRVAFATEKRLPAEFFLLYNTYSLPLQTYPYFRECVNSLFSRMGLPHLTLPLRKYLVGEPR
jgi:preprotein translocase subunit SecB